MSEYSQCYQWTKSLQSPPLSYRPLSSEVEPILQHKRRLAPPSESFRLSSCGGEDVQDDFILIGPGQRDRMSSNVIPYRTSRKQPPHAQSSIELRDADNSTYRDELDDLEDVDDHYTDDSYSSYDEEPLDHKGKASTKPSDDQGQPSKPMRQRALWKKNQKEDALRAELDALRRAEQIRERLEELRQEMERPLEKKAVAKQHKRDVHSSDKALGDSGYKSGEIREGRKEQRPIDSEIDALKEMIRKRVENRISTRDVDKEELGKHRPQDLSSNRIRGSDANGHYAKRYQLGIARPRSPPPHRLTEYQLAFTPRDVCPETGSRSQVCPESGSRSQVRPESGSAAHVRKAWGSDRDTEYDRQFTGPAEQSSWMSRSKTLELEKKIAQMPNAPAPMTSHLHKPTPRSVQASWRPDATPRIQEDLTTEYGATYGAQSNRSARHEEKTKADDHRSLSPSSLSTVSQAGSGWWSKAWLEEANRLRRLASVYKQRGRTSQIWWGEEERRKMPRELIPGPVAGPLPHVDVIGTPREQPTVEAEDRGDRDSQKMKSPDEETLDSSSYDSESDTEPIQPTNDEKLPYRSQLHSSKQPPPQPSRKAPRNPRMFKYDPRPMHGKEFDQEVTSHKTENLQKNPLKYVKPRNGCGENTWSQDASLRHTKVDAPGDSSQRSFGRQKHEELMPQRAPRTSSKGDTSSAEHPRFSTSKKPSTPSHRPSTEFRHPKKTSAQHMPMRMPPAMNPKKTFLKPSHPQKGRSRAQRPRDEI